MGGRGAACLLLVLLLTHSRRGLLAASLLTLATMTRLLHLLFHHHLQPPQRHRLCHGEEGSDQSDGDGEVREEEEPGGRSMGEEVVEKEEFAQEVSSSRRRQPEASGVADEGEELPADVGCAEDTENGTRGTGQECNEMLLVEHLERERNDKRKRSGGEIQRIGSVEGELLPKETDGGEVLKFDAFSDVDDINGESPSLKEDTTDVNLEVCHEESRENVYSPTNLAADQHFDDSDIPYIDLGNMTDVKTFVNKSELINTDEAGKEVKENMEKFECKEKSNVDTGSNSEEGKLCVKICEDKSGSECGEEDIDAAVRWIRSLPPLPGPGCTCKVPGTPPWKLEHQDIPATAPSLPTHSHHHLPSTLPPHPVSSLPPSSSSVSDKKELKMTLPIPVVDEELQDHEGVIPGETSSHSQTVRGLDDGEQRVTEEEPKQRNGVVRGGEQTPLLRANSSDLKEKRRILRSWSLWPLKSSYHEDPTKLSTTSLSRPVSSLDSSSTSSTVASPLCSSSTFASLTVPRRWSRALSEKKRRVHSCIFPDSYSAVPSSTPSPSFNTNLSARVRSEPNVTGKKESKVLEGNPNVVPRRLVRVRSDRQRRKSFTSCIFPDTTNEDFSPYTPVPDRQPYPHDVPGVAKGKGRDWGFQGTFMEALSKKFSSLSKLQGSQSNLIFSPQEACELEGSSLESKLSGWDNVYTPVRHDAKTGQARRPQSLIIIPETQITSASPRSPEPVVPPRDPNLTPPVHAQFGVQVRSRSQRHASAARSVDPSRCQSYFSPTTHGSVVLRENPPERKKLHMSTRSWCTGGEDWAEEEEEYLLGRPPRPRALFPAHHTHPVTPDSVIFPWRRGEPSRGSGGSSPAPGETPTPHTPPHDPSPLDPPPPPDQKQKDGGVWWRGGRGAGVSRTTRKEKASSSPVYRRASLSHSEWDIRRPWSHVYTEREAAKLSQSVCRLAVAAGEEGVTTPVPEEGPRSLPYLPPNLHNTSEGMFQKFKKSLSLRLAKKGSRSESPGMAAPAGGSQSAPIDAPMEPPMPPPEPQTLPRRRSSLPRDDDSNKTFLFGHPLFRSSKERRRARLRDARAAKCNSGDSGDSGIELVTGSGQVGAPGDAPTPSHPELDTNTYVDPAFVASLADEGPSVTSSRAVRRTHSDAGGAGGRGCTYYARQHSTPQPIKTRPAHRLPHHTSSLHRNKSLKRSKGSSHLRRSISQPLDLDKAYDTPTSTLRKCRSPTNGCSRRHRRPSAGNILNDDNTTSEDEIGMSDSEDFRTDLKRSLEEDDDMIVYAEALWDHVTLDSEELVFKAGDLITVIDSSDKDWWWGRISNRAGWFPAAFVRILVNQEDQGTRGHDGLRLLGAARKLSVSGLSHDQIRTNVINEIITTERDFVKHLRDVIKGYLKQVRKRPDMFSDERISTIFGNMEALYEFQSSFLQELEICIDWQEPHKSCIGATFIRNREKFEIYSEYCNNHPAAMSSLQELYQDQKYIHFFEACRLLQEMIDISLDGFLLTPVQKICKYPLQLQELLKYTKAEHPDYNSVKGALEAMRDVALLVNERKRRMECLEKIASWQITVEGWEGPELLEDSSQLIYQGEVTKGVGGSWPKDMTLFLFDHQLVYCKRDLLKRNTFVYRGRLNLDMCEVVNLPDGKDSSLNISVHNGWKIHSLGKNKWYVFSSKSATEKRKWMEAFRKERELVAADERAGFAVAEKAKHLARVAARNQRNRPKRPRSLWFSFGGHKKGRGSGRTTGQIQQHHPV